MYKMYQSADCLSKHIKSIQTADTNNDSKPHLKSLSHSVNLVKLSSICRKHLLTLLPQQFLTTEIDVENIPERYQKVWRSFQTNAGSRDKAEPEQKHIKRHLLASIVKRMFIVGRFMPFHRSNLFS